jgi:hypothetical protein
MMITEAAVEVESKRLGIENGSQRLMMTICIRWVGRGVTLTLMTRMRRMKMHTAHRLRSR